MNRPAGGPLGGLAVIDLTRGGAGGVATMLLADYGADVLRVEPPGGDPYADEIPGYRIWHRGKRVVEIDLADARGREALLARLPAADALVESHAPGAMERLGIGYDAVAKAAPALVYVSISAYGERHPDRHRPGHDALVQARYGVGAFQGRNRDGPALAALAWPTLGAGILGLIGMLAALKARRRHGRGQLVETSLLDGLLAQSTMFLVAAERSRESLGGSTPLSGRAPTMGIYACRDGRYLQIHAGQRGGLERLVRVTGLPTDGLVDDRSGRHLASDPDAASRLRSALEGAFGVQTRDEWIARLHDADVAAAPCLEPKAIFDLPQAEAIGAVCEQHDPTLGAIRTVGLPLRFERSPGEIRGPARHLGAAVSPEATLRHSGWAVAAEDASSQAGGVSGAARLDLSGTDPRELGNESESACGRPPLADVTVLDFGMFAAGPYAASLLAELGADVIKIEPPSGDSMRPSLRSFLGVQRGKRALALDLKRPEARDVVARLVRRADVVMHNLRPGVAERLGIGWKDLEPLRPGLIYCHSSAYGSHGPMADLPGFDQIYQALSGLDVLQGGRDGPPEQVAGAPLDYTNALLSAAAVLMALEWRSRTGEGQLVECPQLAAGVLAVADHYEAVDPLLRGRALAADQLGTSPFHRYYRASDGAWLFVSCPDGEARQRFTALVGSDPEPFFASLAADRLLDELRRAGIPCERARQTFDASILDDEGLCAEGRVVETDHPRFGRVRQAGRFVRFSLWSAAGNTMRHAPGIGEHTREILADLGMSPLEVAGLIERGVVLAP